MKSFFSKWKSNGPNTSSIKQNKTLHGCRWVFIVPFLQLPYRFKNALNKLLRGNDAKNSRGSVVDKQVLEITINTCFHTVEKINHYKRHS